MNPTRHHGSLGENIKVHFAGAEVIDFAYILHDAGVNYFLFTIFDYISEQFGIKRGGFTNTKHLIAPVELPKISKHLIMDSGLFTLMFGAGKGKKVDEKLISSWEAAIVDFVKRYQAWDIAVVECDCQKLLGTGMAWKLRERMKKELPQNRIINVFHFEDGRDGLNALIDFSDYMAISVPEMRIVKPKTYEEDVYALASYIKDRKPGIDIHLLGCTQKSILTRCKFCTTSDSTSWLQVNRYGRLLGRKTSEIKKSVLLENRDNIARILVSLGVEPTERRLNYYGNYWLAGKLLKREYTSWVGSQE